MMMMQFNIHLVDLLTFSAILENRPTKGVKNVA